MVVLEVLTGVQRPAGTHVQAPLEVQQALFAGAPERRAVCVRGAEVGVPGVQVGVEVQDRDLAVVAGQRPQQRQGDGVVTADRQQFRPVRAHVIRSCLDLRDGLAQVERVDGNVSGIGDLVLAEGLHRERRVVGAQKLGGGTDVAGTETGARAIGDAGVERHAEDGHVDRRHLVGSGKSGECRGPRVPGDLGGVRWAADGGSCHRATPLFGGLVVDGRRIVSSVIWPRCISLRIQMNMMSNQ